jgi:hypothetical protein
VDQFLAPLFASCLLHLISVHFWEGPRHCTPSERTRIPPALEAAIEVGLDPLKHLLIKGLFRQFSYDEWARFYTDYY